MGLTDLVLGPVAVATVYSREIAKAAKFGAVGLAAIGVVAVGAQGVSYYSATQEQAREALVAAEKAKYSEQTRIEPLQVQYSVLKASLVSARMNGRIMFLDTQLKSLDDKANKAFEDANESGLRNALEELNGFNQYSVVATFPNIRREYYMRNSSDPSTISFGAIANGKGTKTLEEDEFIVLLPPPWGGRTLIQMANEDSTFSNTGTFSSVVYKTINGDFYLALAKPNGIDYLSLGNNSLERRPFAETKATIFRGEVPK